MCGAAVLSHAESRPDLNIRASTRVSMNSARITGLRSIELGVTDLHQSAAFYGAIWGLDPIASDADTIHLRGNGTEHHVVTLRERPKAGMLGIHFATIDRTAVDALHAKAKAFGANVTSAPAELPRSAGGGYGFGFRSPEGHVLNISSDVAQHPNVVLDRSKPTKLSHVVINSAEIDGSTAFFIDLLGFRLSDSTDMMNFVRCSRDHHSIALARGEGPSLNHMAYEVENIDGLMRGAGRLKQCGFNVEWGVGRHGPGDNVFSYFVEPNGFVVEYTTEVEQIDEATYLPHDPTYWREFPMRPCRWGMGGHPSNRLKAAFSGDISVADPQDGPRCEEIMAKTLGR
jgi:catechol 2,3-dioxygenase